MLPTDVPYDVVSGLDGFSAPEGEVVTFLKGAKEVFGGTIVLPPDATCEDAELDDVVLISEVDSGVAGTSVS